MNKNKKIIGKSQMVICWFVCIFTFSCDYLDIVPDNVLTVDYAFYSRYEAEGYLYGLYGYLPNFAHPSFNPAFMSGEEMWYLERGQVNGRMWDIARGFQTTSAPMADCWASCADEVRYNLNGGRPLFSALSDCNIFLENIGKVRDQGEGERTRWIAEVKFLKAYYHYYLLRMYGPIPIIRENRSLDDPGQFFREPVDDVVEYIVSLIDEALPDLPPRIDDVMNEAGRVTQPIALAVKAQLLTLAASPLFNGNEDFAFFADKRGTLLFPQTYSAEKWKRAVDALKAAIDAAHHPDEITIGYSLYDFEKESMYVSNLSQKTILAMQVRGAATDRWNSEILWGDPLNSTATLQQMCHPWFFIQQGSGAIYRNYAVPLHIVEQFYTKNGIPIEEDKDWAGVDKFGLRQGNEEHRYYIAQNQTTINLHFDREARFYGAVTFDQGTYYGNNRIMNDDPSIAGNVWITDLRNTPGNPGGYAGSLERHWCTGYGCKKLLNYRTSVPDLGNILSSSEYAFPIIRLADLYLMYAEALNEWKDSPDEEVYEYIDKVRARTGLSGVLISWGRYAADPSKPLTKIGMRDIIRRERMNELAFEGIRFWDLKRWKLAKEYMNRPIRGLNIFGETAEDYYQVQTLYSLTYQDKDYLWPIRQSILTRNVNLVQNPGWW